MIKLDQAVRARESFAASIFEKLRQETHDGVGITRASYGEGEQFAHTLMGDYAKSLGLEVEYDAAGNAFILLPGIDRDAPKVIVGSHLDSVARGGNFDGAAGVIAGLVAIAAMQDAGVVPARDVCLMAIRGEEGEWFGVPYIGSRAALGTLPASALGQAKRVDTGITLYDHMVLSHCDPDAIRDGQSSLQPTHLHAFIELHIEQGPVLDEAAIPVGLVTGIRGNRRLLRARCLGEYSHCGGIPRTHRRDAVVAVAKFIESLDAIWTECEANDQDFAFTVGQLFTDESHHTLSKISGEVTFSLDMRSLDGQLLEAMELRVAKLAEDIGRHGGVTFELGDFLRAEPGVMSSKIREELSDGIATLGIRSIELGSGGSHDAAAFAAAGVPSAMLFIRNANGSHNPHEDMALCDFTEATRVLAWWLAHCL